MKFKTPEQYKEASESVNHFSSSSFPKDLMLGMDGFDEKYEIHADHYLMSRFLSSKSLNVDSVMLSILLMVLVVFH